MTLARAKPANWVPLEKLTSAQMNAIDSQLPYAVDGNAGGTYAPSGLISIGGSGLRVTTALSVTGAGSVNLYSGAVVVDATSFTLQGIAVDFGTLSDVTFENGFASLGTVDFQNGLGVSAGNVVINPGNLTVTAGDLTLTAGNLDVGGNGVISGTFGVLGAASFAAATAVSFGAGSGFAATATTFALSNAVTATIAGPLTLSGTTTLTGVIAPSGVGRMRDRVHVGTDANITVGIADGDIIIVPAFAANRTWTVTSTGAGDGDHFIMDATALTGAFDVQLIDDVAAPILALKNNISGDARLALFYFYSGAWRARVLDRTT